MVKGTGGKQFSSSAFSDRHRKPCTTNDNFILPVLSTAKRQTKEHKQELLYLSPLLAKTTARHTLKGTYQVNKRNQRGYLPDTFIQETADGGFIFQK